MPRKDFTAGATGYLRRCVTRRAETPTRAGRSSNWRLPILSRSIVVNNAGVAALGITEAFAPAQFDAIFDVNGRRALLPRVLFRHELDISSSLP